MGNDQRYLCLVETRRLLLLMGVVFGFFLFIQCFELPYTNILSSLFASGKSSEAPLYNFPSLDSSGNLTTSRNQTHFSSLNTTDVDVVDGISSTTKVIDGNDVDVNNPNNTLNDNIDPEDESPFKDFVETDNNSTVEGVVGNSNFPLEKHREIADELPEPESTTRGSVDHDGVGDNVQKSDKNENNIVNQETHPITSTGKGAENTLKNNENRKIPKDDHHEPKNEPEPAVVPISTMNNMLLQSRVTYRPVKPRWSSKVDQELLNAKALIENAPIIEKDPQFDVNLYRNFSAFKRSYELMEQTLKVYIYAEGERPIFHQPPLKGIYASEGWFMKLLKANKRFVTKKPNKAHLFYLPFSSRALEVALYVPNSHNRKPLIARLSDYVQTITTKYHFWNRTGGADHFLVACHDWAPSETRQIMANCIRALCNSDVKEGFQFGKEVSLPETYIKAPQNPLRERGGKSPSQRRILAFFAGNMHGYLRPILLKHWENKDPDMKIFGPIPKAKKGQTSYAQYMKSSKYCICAKGFEVNSPRVVEAIFYECVPVIISDNFVPPFFETLNWESFAVFVLEKDIPNLKNILLSIPKKQYLRMQRRVKQVQQHFLWHPRPVKYDVFHMILHSVWYNRVFQTRPW